MEKHVGKHLKTDIDRNMIRDLARELCKHDSNNDRLQHYLSMDNHEGAELRNYIKDLVK
jgi:hypothetical protein